MAPIQRRRFLDTSENPPQSDQPELEFESTEADSHLPPEQEPFESKVETTETAIPAKTNPLVNHLFQKKIKRYLPNQFQFLVNE